MKHTCRNCETYQLWEYNGNDSHDFGELLLFSESENVGEDIAFCTTSGLVVCLDDIDEDNGCKCWE